MLKTVAITSGSGGGNGTVTQVGGTGTVNGITLTGNVTTTGNLTLGGTLGNIANSQLTNSAVTIGNTSVSLGSTITNIGNLTLANVTITSGTVPAANVTGLGTMATQNANAVVVTGGSINNTAIGNATANTGVFTTLTNTGTAYLGGASGNQSLQIDNIASAVNYARIIGATAGNGVTFSAQGSDLNINARLIPKGTGYTYLGNIVNIGADYSVSGILNLAGNTNVISGVGVQGVYASMFVDSTKTGGANMFSTYPNTQATSFTLASLGHYKAAFGGLGAGSSITNQYGFQADNSLIGATNNYGFYSNIAAATGRFNFYANGTAANYFAGQTTLNGIVSSLSTKTANYTLVATDHTVLGNATTASFSLTLPTSVGATGQVYIIKKVDSTANTVTILTTSSQTIDGSTSKVLSYQYDGFQLQSDGANWMIIGNIFGRNGTVGTF